MLEPTVASVMTTDVITVRPDTPFKAIVATMMDNHVSAVPVVAAGAVVGVVSEADVLPKQEFRGGPDDPPRSDRGDRIRWYRSRGLTAAELMSVPVLTIAIDEPVTVAAKRLAKEGIRRLFAVDRAGRLVGVVSRRDVLGLFLRGDAEIRTDIERQVLNGTDLAAVPITASVVAGVATLDGTLERRSDIEVVCRRTQAIPGVVAVRGNLRYRIDDSVAVDR